MKKTALFLFAALFAFALQSQAQVRGGIRAGLNMATWGGDAVQSFSDLLNSTGVMRGELLPAFHAGAYLQLPLGAGISLEPGLYYSGKGVQVNQTFASESIFKPQVNLVNRMHYVEMPVLLRLHLGPGFQLYGGPQLAYLINNQLEAEAGIFGFSYEHNWSVDPGFRKLDVGLTGGLGYELPNGINLQAGYERGLSSLDKGNSNIDAFNSVIKVSLGYTFGK